MPSGSQNATSRGEWTFRLGTGEYFDYSWRLDRDSSDLLAIDEILQIYPAKLPISAEFDHDFYSRLDLG